MTKFKKIRRLPMDLERDRGGHVRMFNPVRPVPMSELNGYVDIRAMAEQEKYREDCRRVGIRALPPIQDGQ